MPGKLHMIPGNRLPSTEYGESAGVHDVDMPNIRQGWLESSNVDLNREFTQLMAIQRNYQACRQAMRMIDNIDAKTVTICRAGT